MTFLSLSWRSLHLSKRSLKHPKKVTKNCHVSTVAVPPNWLALMGTSWRSKICQETAIFKALPKEGSSRGSKSNQANSVNMSNLLVQPKKHIYKPAVSYQWITRVTHCIVDITINFDTYIIWPNGIIFHQPRFP